MSANLYEKNSERRKKEQAEGLVPEWYSTASAQMFYEKYEYQTEGRSVRGQFERIAKTAAKYLPESGLLNRFDAESRFFDMLWNGWLSPSTPVLANMGTNRGMSVSCSGGSIEDSIDGFYKNRHETAQLTKYGFGTSADLSKIRSRGSSISVGGKASGVVPVFKGHVADMREVAQGTARRGAWAGYLDIEHGDFNELADFIQAEPDDANVGWIIKDSFLEKMKSGDQDANSRFQKAMKLKMITGKGYFFFVDKVARKRPRMYKDLGLDVKASNLCSEITLFADKDHSFTCVLSSINVTKIDAVKENNIVYWATVFLDCVAQDFIAKGKGISGLEKTVRFTEKGRALGLGQCGFHTLLQQRMIPFESVDAHILSQEIAKHLWDESLRASQDMAKILGEPEWCKGYGVRNTHRLCCPPTKSTSAIMGGISEGINPDPAMTFTQLTSAGEIDRINPVLLSLMKKKGVYTKKHLAEVSTANGSVQSVDWLDEFEKSVFRTAFEINQEAIIRLAAARGKFIDQWQSVNLFFSSNETPERIAEVHQIAFENEGILGLYYVYTMSGIKAAEISECIACS